MPITKKVERIILMYPNQRWHKFDLTTTWNLSPYSLCILATMLGDKYEIKIVDAQFYDMSKEEFIKIVKEFKPDCVGISVLTSEYATILDVAASIVKGVDRNIITIAGGVHVTTQYTRVMENKDIDYAIRGEGEFTLQYLVDYLNRGKEFPEKGVVYRKSNNDIVALPSEVVEDIDSLPFPDYELIDYPAYLNTKPRYGVDTVNVFPYARILTSRGCPVGCSFCQVKNISGSKWRPRSAENVVNEIVFLKERYGIKAFIFEDDNPFYQKERTKKLFRLLKECNLNLKWKAAGVAAFKMDEETFSLMAETGCQMIGMAIESGNERILKDVIRKPVNLKEIPGLIKMAQKYGIFVVCNFIIGFPGESWDEIRQTLGFAESCGADYCKIYAANPLIGTKMFEIAKKLDVIDGSESDVNWRYGRIKSDEFSPKDISTLRVYEWDRINFTDRKKREKTAEIMGISLLELNNIRKATRDNLRFDDFSAV